MHTPVFHIVIVWSFVMVGALTVYALRASTEVGRILALDCVALVLVATLAVIALKSGEPGYLDVALVLAMLAFAQTVGAVRLLLERMVEEE